MENLDAKMIKDLDTRFVPNKNIHGLLNSVDKVIWPQ